MQSQSFLPALAFAGTCLVCNGLVFSLGWNIPRSPQSQPWFAPPGWVVSAVWLVLFAMMGLIYARLCRIEPSASWTMIALAAACLAYPLYTGGFQNASVGLIGNFATLAATLVLIGYLKRIDTTSALLLTPMTVWLVFASVITAASA